jgi:hypothetical protein
VLDTFAIELLGNVTRFAMTRQAVRMITGYQFKNSGSDSFSSRKHYGHDKGERTMEEPATVEASLDGIHIQSRVHIPKID